MRIDSGELFFLVAIVALAGGIAGWNVRNTKVKELIKGFAWKETRLTDQAKAVISQVAKDRDAALDMVKTIEDRLNNAKNHNSQLVAKSQEYERALEELRKSNEALHSTYTACVEKIKQESALLPSVVEWASRIQEAIDADIVKDLVEKDRPALKAAEEVKEARAIARGWKKESDILRNRIALYEAEAPWLVEFVDYSVEDIVEGLRQEVELQRAVATGNDPSRLFVSISEWASLTEGRRNQLALDRYWEYRQRNAWVAGIQYERFVGYSYEKNGFEVEYHGATKGVSDLGIDLVCCKDGKAHLVQCKRLSIEKGYPVRENTIAQIFGASLYYAHKKGISRDSITPVVVTTFDLSGEAKEFANALNVQYRERNQLERYPCIKCNIGAESGEKIYHLPFDQQYDVTRIEPEKGEFYAMTVAEAERRGFRRAFRWMG